MPPSLCFIAVVPKTADVVQRLAAALQSCLAPSARCHAKAEMSQFPAALQPQDKAHGHEAWLEDPLQQEGSGGSAGPKNDPSPHRGQLLLGRHGTCRESRARATGVNKNESQVPLGTSRDVRTLPHPATHDLKHISWLDVFQGGGSPTFALQSLGFQAAPP